MIRKTPLLLALLAVFAFGFASCSSTTKSSSATLCGECGWVKGTDKCCAEGATKCSCGLAKGSPGCCKVPAGSDAVLCQCGEVMNGDKCCRSGADRCGCGAIKGSPGCCLKKKQDAQ